VSSVPLEKPESKENLAIGEATDSQVDGETLERRVTKEYQAQADHPDSREHADQLVRPEMLDRPDHPEKSSRSKDRLERRDPLVLPVEREAIQDRKAMKGDEAETATSENMGRSDQRQSAVNSHPIISMTRMKKVMRNRVITAKKRKKRNPVIMVVINTKNPNTMVTNKKNPNTMVTNRKNVQATSIITEVSGTGKKAMSIGTGTGMKAMSTIGTGKTIRKKNIKASIGMGANGRATKRPTTKSLRAKSRKKRPLKLRLGNLCDPVEAVTTPKRMPEPDSNILSLLINQSLSFFFVISHNLM